MECLLKGIPQYILLGINMTEKQIYYLNIYDKNGIEIKSTDKIKFHNTIGYIYYNIGSCNFQIKWEDGNSRNLDEIFAKEIEVIND